MREERGTGDADFDGKSAAVECVFVNGVVDDIAAADGGAWRESDDAFDEAVECLSTKSPKGVMRIPVEKVLSGGWFTISPRTKSLESVIVSLILLFIRMTYLICLSS